LRCKKNEDSNNSNGDMTTAAARGAILITGASRGIGSALVRATAAASSTDRLDIILVGRCPISLKETMEKIHSIQSERNCDPGVVDHHHSRLHAVAADVSTSAGRQTIMSAVHDIPSHLAYVVHNAGTLGPLRHFRDVDENSSVDVDSSRLDLDTWRSTFATNVEAPLFLTRDLLPSLIASSHARGTPSRVLTLSSGAAFNSTPASEHTALRKQRSTA
jgi:NAD(P)-dependent dehydrogenase (short-subunit alcohol dehydrogenase family)